MLTTTFERLREAGACTPSYRYLAKALGGIRKYGEAKPIPLSVILEHNGLEDAIWALPTATVPDDQKPKMERFARLFACWCARNTPLPDGRTVWDLLTDESSRAAIEVAERFANNEATNEELASAEAAAWAVVPASFAATGRRNDVAWAASAAASAADDDAAYAAWTAARDVGVIADLDAEADAFRMLLEAECS